MFTNYDEEFNAQTSALESLLNELDDEMAMEGLFSKPKSADQMLDKVKKNISKKCKTVEDCDDMLAKLKNEEEKFNSALKTMKDAAVQFKNGEIDKKELKNIVKPAAAELKKTCNIISLKDINADTNNVTDEEIQKLHDFLVGTREAINERKKELSSEGNDDTAEESLVGGYLGYLDDDMVDAATEAVQTAEIAMEGALETLRNAVIKFCESCASKCLTKAMAARKDGDDKKKATWEKWANVFRGIADKCKKANSEAEVKAQEKHAKKVQEDIEKAANKMASGKGNSMHSATKESFTFENDPYLRMLEAASEAYDLAKADYELAMESLMYSTDDDDMCSYDTAIESVASVTFSAVLALAAAFDSNSRQAWRLKNSEAKKAVDKSIKEAKAAVKAGDSDKAINLYKNAIKGYQGILAAVKKVPNKTSADTGVSKYIEKGNSASAGKNAAIQYLEEKISQCEDAILKIKEAPLKAARKQAEKDERDAKRAAKKNKNTSDEATESFLNDALFELDMAIEGMTIDDDEEPLEGLDDALESMCNFDAGTQSFLEELL